MDTIDIFSLVIFSIGSFVFLVLGAVGCSRLLTIDSILTALQKGQNEIRTSDAELPTYKEYKEWQAQRPDLPTYEQYKEWLEIKGEEDVADDGDVEYWSQDNG